jgi:hypothetical protein
MGLLKLADWGPAHTLPSGRIPYQPVKYHRAPKSETFVFLLVELRIKSFNTPDDDYSLWFTMMSDPDDMPSSRMKYRNGDVELTLLTWSQQLPILPPSV